MALLGFLQSILFIAMNESQKKKTKFRSSVKWKKFKHFMNVEQGGLCFITHKKLLKGANLHHLDLNAEHYEDLSNPDHFAYLNKSLHDVVHTLYRYYSKDPEVLDRLKEILDKMVEINLSSTN